MYFLLIGYVNQDAKRRDMGQVLWTLLVIFIPNGMGFLAYFLLRKPLVRYCPKCGDRVETGFHFCAKCGCELSPSCGPVDRRSALTMWFARTAGSRWRRSGEGMSNLERPTLSQTKGKDGAPTFCRVHV